MGTPPFKETPISSYHQPTSSNVPSIFLAVATKNHHMNLQHDNGWHLCVHCIPNPNQCSIEWKCIQRYPIDLYQAWSPAKWKVLMIPDFWRPVSAEMQTGFGVPFGVCMERAQVLFFSKISEILGTVEIDSLMFLMQDLLPPKTGVCSSGETEIAMKILQFE